jgi:hypothetical protein
LNGYHHTKLTAPAVWLEPEFSRSGQLTGPESAVARRAPLKHKHSPSIDLTLIVLERFHNEIVSNRTTFIGQLESTVNRGTDPGKALGVSVRE